MGVLQYIYFYIFDVLSSVYLLFLCPFFAFHLTQKRMNFKLVINWLKCSNPTKLLRQNRCLSRPFTSFLGIEKYKEKRKKKNKVIKKKLSHIFSTEESGLSSLVSVSSFPLKKVEKTTISVVVFVLILLSSCTQHSWVRIAIPLAWTV